MVSLLHYVKYGDPLYRIIFPGPVCFANATDRNFGRQTRSGWGGALPNAPCHPRRAASGSTGPGVGSGSIHERQMARPMRERERDGRMPWKEPEAMDQRIELAMKAFGRSDCAGVCREFGISRKPSRPRRIPPEVSKEAGGWASGPSTACGF